MYKQIAANKRKTVFLFIGFVVFIGLLGAIFAWAMDSWTIAIWTLVIALVYALIQYFASSSLAVAMTGAREIEKKDNPKLYNTVENLTLTAGLPMPKVYIIDDKAPNAFATGRDPAHAVVAATTGL
ncbi:M48 family metalloprotease, partial [Candidatus Saccharibacteria bacterium]|nr:M48 family metalloprotease [Candidatus Saccharibacteria bacterium]